MDTEVKRCGRPKVNGQPCQNMLNPTWQIVCKVHRTEADAEREEWGRTIWQAAWKRGYEMGESVGRAVAENEERNRRREEESAARFRLFDFDGAQIVQVLKGYSYKWNGELLAVGDRVLVPGNWLFKQAQWLEVKELGSDYQGEMSHILRAEKQAR